MLQYSQHHPGQTRGEMDYNAGTKTTTTSFNPDETMLMDSTLRKKLGPEHISSRQGMGNSRLSYVEGWRIISIANEIFGFNGWSSSIQNLTIDFMDITESGRFNVGASCVVRITLKDGNYREDVGFGMIENSKSKGQAFEKVKKEATTDALKRAMRQFGNLLGNCVYDKEFVKGVSGVQKEPRARIQGDSLFRSSDLENYRTLADDGVDFDMDELDDASMMDMIEDLESNRPVIPESPHSFGFARGASPPPQQHLPPPARLPPPQQQQQQQNTPMRSNQESGGAHRKPMSVPTMQGNSTSTMTRSAGASATAAHNASVGANRSSAAGGSNVSAVSSAAARNLNFQSIESRSRNASAAERPRSFANISSFMPVSQSSTVTNGSSSDGTAGTSEPT
ncbi:DNA repair protein rad52 [Coemansia sp. Benny D115]|nr:DNA repair protein rad52 [Coemansia sp. Benny D115]